ncbi:MAG: cbb3-type cytochrome c oxidase subunit II [Luteolibacter sp.]|uniref:cbb3-type cytochrome c oxidase subunit II n=1 Tax=Luteolibacter sp. TaxID=1962973 RepID=UPI003266C4CA
MKLTAIRAAVVVAAVYGYFLIFAQFAFVELLRAGGASLTQEKVALGSMALAGFAGGFLAAWRGASPAMVRIALALAAVSSVLAPFANAMPGALGIAIATGAALGVATVSLAAMVPAWCGVAWVGLGTGLGYAVCNFPAIFTQTPVGQAYVGTGFAIAGLLAVPSLTKWREHELKKIFPLWGAIALFTALVWMDSAAFFIIQHSTDLKNGTWGTGLLWRNAAVHLSVAIAAGFWLARGGARMLPAFAWAILAVAALAVNGGSTRDLAGWLYPAGVSLYSAALVAWPGWFSGVSGPRRAGWRAAWLFAIAGWFGSANGIGMAQTLQRVPPEFVALSGALVVAVMVLSDLKHWRSAAAVAAVILTAMLFPKTATTPVGDAFERGRQVYLSEGCIHCHSQYVRPDSLDVANWGPVKSVGDVFKGEPVLIGNRRQGPDLTNVGARRSAAWLKLHFINPQVFVPGSAMPSYAHLFESGKGDDLVRYLKQAGENQMGGVVETASKWQPHGSAEEADGKSLFATNCATCHGSNGLGNGPISLELARKPANLVAGPFAWTPAGEILELRVARVIKFGLPGTDMPGHEVLTDGQVLALRDWVLQLRAAP